ncbi:unnamed protein product, partial [marine sediment metagenome]
LCFNNQNIISDNPKTGKRRINETSQEHIFKDNGGSNNTNDSYGLFPDA